MEALEQEIQTYQSHLPSLLLEEGKFALIRGKELIAVFDTYADALSAGYERFSTEPFLVKQIQAIEQAHYISHC